MSGKMVINKLIFRLFFAKELRKMARARQELAGCCSLGAAVVERLEFDLFRWFRHR